ELGNPFLNPLTDSAVLPSLNSRLAFTTDSYVVKPPFFPGGDIGRLAVFGTVNDLSVMGARPLYLSLGFILEEGFPMGDLERVVRSIKTASHDAGVIIVTGDTKVTEKGKGDGIFINTSGIGVIGDGIEFSVRRVEVGDKIIVSGPVGDHGAAVMSVREGLYFDTPIESDCAPLNYLIKKLIPIGGIKFMRDPTRGGLAGVLNEVAEVGFEIMVQEESIPVREEVRGLSELLGIDPLYMACEGRVVIICSEMVAGDIVELLRKGPIGSGASVIGEVIGHGKGVVYLHTLYGTKRMMDMPTGENLPRIC
ncbi:MAG: hydrogenase expression/formation protein HypE, partial [Deltaproteobacteria bacterium]|nr:hydrogenase expression/formation protein HypE [Deltaproteobacteria bacterium]